MSMKKSAKKLKVKLEPVPEIEGAQQTEKEKDSEEPLPSVSDEENLKAIQQLQKDQISTFFKKLFPNKEEASMRLKYLESVRKPSELPIPLSQAIEIFMEESEAERSGQLQKADHWALKINSLPKTETEELIPSPNQKIEDDILKSKLRDIHRMKEELEQKLLGLSANAELLQQGFTSPMKLHKDQEYYKLTKEERKTLKEQFNKKQEEALEFVKKRQIEEKLWKQKVKQKQRQERERIKKEMEEREEKLRIHQAELKAERQEEMRKNYEMLKQRREQDIKKQQEQEQLHPPQPVYLYQKIQDRYTSKVLMPELEAQKKLLAEKRSLFKSVTKEELDEHERKIELLEKKREDSWHRNILKQQEEQEKIGEKLKQFKTKLSEIIQDREEKERENLENKQKQKKIVREKMESYSNIVREIAPVTTSEAKAKELQSMIDKLKHPVKKSRDVRKLYQLSTINNRGAAKSARSIDRKFDPNLSLGDQAQLKQLKGKTPRPLADKLELEAKIAAGQKKKLMQEKIQQKDYLSELRKKREEQYNISRPNKFQWESDIRNNDLCPMEKRERIERKARLIEEQAHAKEKLYNLKGGVDKNMELGEYVSDMYLDAIRAKLSILNNF